MELNLTLEMKKQFIKDPNKGWMWYKAWRLPKIEVMISASPPELNLDVNNIPIPSGIYV